MEGQVLIREIIFEIIVNQLDFILTATFNGTYYLLGFWNFLPLCISCEWHYAHSSWLLQTETFTNNC